MGGLTQRNRGLIRQWRLIRALARARHGLTFKQLRNVADEPVCLKTIRREVDTLTFAGFPIDVVSDFGNGSKVHLRNWSIH